MYPQQQCLESRLLHILVSTWYWQVRFVLNHSNRCLVYFIVVLFSISLMTSNTEYHFMSLFPFICLLMCFFKYFAYSLLGCFLIIEVWESLYNLDTSRLGDTCFANIFSQSVACLFILLTVPFEEQNFLIFTKSNWSLFSFLGYAFCIRSK